MGRHYKPSAGLSVTTIVPPAFYRQMTESARTQQAVCHRFIVIVRITRTPAYFSSGANSGIMAPRIDPKTSVEVYRETQQ
jgi:hypothetical protein